MYSDRRRVALVGGSGFVGRNLSLSLVKRGFLVQIIDISPCPVECQGSPLLSHRQLDMTRGEELTQLLHEFHPDIVVDIAGWGMSGVDMLDPKCNTINFLGTERLINACVANNIARLIYTSTYNVVFRGKEIDGGDELQPYALDTDHLDQYSRSKSRAEQLVLQSNGKTLPDGRKLLTSVIRPAAIYGENEQRHLPRILQHMDMGLFLFRIGSAKVDWVHIENLVLAYELLVDKLLSVDDPAVRPAGQPYFISDGSPIDNFEFLKPLCLARGRRFPTTILPVGFMFVVSGMFELVYFAGKAVGLTIPPPLTRAEVAKIGVSHHFSMKNALQDFGYRPKFDSIQGGERLGVHYRNFPDNNFFEIAAPLWFFLVLSGLTFLYLAAFGSEEFVSSRAWLQAIYSLGAFLFGSKSNLQVLFQCSLLLHFLEAVFAATIASSYCPNTVLLWFGQTLMLGYPSLRLLLNRSKPAH